MSKGLHRALSLLLAPMPFVLGTWTVAAWLIFQRSVGGFLGLFILVPVVFAQFAILGIALWLRPSFRVQRVASKQDALWYFTSLVLWTVVVAIPTAWGGLAQMLAVVFTAFAITRVWRKSRTEADAALRQRADRARQSAGRGSRGPQAGRVIVIDTHETWREQPNERIHRTAETVEAEIIEEPVASDGPDKPDEWTAREHRPDIR